MYKPRTIAQFKVMECLKEWFCLEACFVAPISRDGLMLEDRDGEKIAFELRGSTIEECPIPPPGSRSDLRAFSDMLRYYYPEVEQQTLEAKTGLWLKSPVSLTYQQALGLADDLFRHYLTYPMLEGEEDVWRLIAKGGVSVHDYNAIKLWYLDGHISDTQICPAGVDGKGLFVELTTRYNRPDARCFRFYLEDV